MRWRVGKKRADKKKQGYWTVSHSGHQDVGLCLSTSEWKQGSEFKVTSYSREFEASPRLFKKILDSLGPKSGIEMEDDVTLR